MPVLAPLIPVIQAALVSAVINTAYQGITTGTVDPKSVGRSALIGAGTFGLGALGGSIGGAAGTMGNTIGSTIGGAAGAAGGYAAGSAATGQKIEPMGLGMSALGGAVVGYSGTPGLAQSNLQQAQQAGGGFFDQVWQSGRGVLGMQPSTTAGSQMGQGALANQGGTAPLEMYGQAGSGVPSATDKLFYSPGVGWSTQTSGQLATVPQYAEQLSGAGVNVTGGGTPEATASQTNLNLVGGAKGSGQAPGLLTGGAGSAGGDLLRTAGGLGVSALGSGISMPEAPQFPSEVGGQDIAARTLGGSPLAQLSEQRAMEVIGGEPLTAEDEEAIVNIYNEREQSDLSQLAQRYQFYGRAGSEEHLAAEKDRQSYWETTRAGALVAARQEAQQMQNNMLQAAWNYDQNQVNQILDLADRQGRTAEVEYLIRAGDTIGLRNLFNSFAEVLWGQSASGSYQGPLQLAF